MKKSFIDVQDPKPVQDEAYVALGTAVVNLEQAIDAMRTARDTAKNEEDWKDRDVIRTLTDDAEQRMLGRR